MRGDGRRRRSRDGRRYAFTSYMLRAYYRRPDLWEDIGRAVEAVKEDPYFQVIPAFYRDHMPAADIGIAYHCDERTVNRHKRRLCLEIYRHWESGT